MKITRRLFPLILLLMLQAQAVINPAKAQINTERMMAIGRNALYFEDYVLSIQYFNQVIGAKPYQAEPWFFRAVAKLYLEDYKGSEEDCSEALKRNNFMVRAYMCRSYARMNLKNYKGAIEDCEKGLEFDIDNKVFMQNRAIAYLNLKDYAETKKYLAEYISKFSGEVTGYMISGQLKIETGDTLAAVEDFSRAISIDRYFAPARSGRAYAYLLLEKYSNAIPDLDEAIRLEPEVPSYYINRGLARYNVNNLRGTLDDFDRVITLDPNNELAYFNRGIIRQQVGDFNRAIEDFDKVIYFDPQHFTAIYNRALLRGQVGDYKGAISDLNKIVAEYPNFTPAIYQRSDMKKKLGDLKGADRDYFAAWNQETKLKAEREARKRNPQKYAAADSIKEAEREKKRNMDRYNKVIIAENDDTKKGQQDNPMRGRVQDRNVEVEMVDIFTLTFYEQSRPGPARRPMDYNHYLAQLSQSGLKDYQKLVITNTEVALNDEQANYHFRMIDELSSQISNTLGEAVSASNQGDSENSVDTIAIKASEQFFARGLNFALVQDLTSSLDDINKSLIYNDKFALAYFERANVRYRKIKFEYNEKLAEEESFNKSNIDYNQQRKTINPFSKSASNLSIGESAFGSDYELVMRDYDKVIELDPRFIYAWFNRGCIRSMQRDYRNALIDFTKSIELNPDFADAWFNRGITQIYLGDREHGIADLRMAGQLGMYKAYNLIKRFESQ